MLYLCCYLDMYVQGSIFIFSQSRQLGKYSKNMLALAIFGLPFQKWRIIGKKKGDRMATC